MSITIQNQMDNIEKIIDALVDIYSPLSVYIFGSYAWGTPNENSDLDFAVIVDSSDLSMADRIRLASKAMWGIGIPIDILVYTKAEIQERSKLHSTLQYRILNQGTKVYEAA